MSVELCRVTDLGDEILPLVAEAAAEGHRFMARLSDEWQSGANRFDGPGEVLLGAYVGGQLAALGGLNIDPYCDAPGVGRVRHVYVATAVRRIGIGSLLVEAIVERAGGAFTTLRLRTSSVEAAAFYERVGFRLTREAGATHAIEIGAGRWVTPPNAHDDEADDRRGGAARYNPGGNGAFRSSFNGESP